MEKIKKIISHFREKRNHYRFVIVVSVLLLCTIFIDKIIFASNIFQEKYGVNLVFVAWFFGVSEVFFILGIIIILKATGVFKIRWSNIREFNIKNAKIEGRWMYSGLLINRTAAIIPWLYILIAGWSKLPIYIILPIFTEIVIVLVLGSMPFYKRVIKS